MSLRRLLLAALVCLPFAARAESSLDLQSWLDRPGVRAVVVEFYATWCEPCMKAMPRWKALKEKYGREGLRVIVVNTCDEDDPGKCVSLGWRPDALICDTDGVIDERFGVKGKLPSAFLWSWEHKLLVQRGHVTEVEAAVESLFKALPRVEVSSDGAEKDAVEEVTAAINYSAKMRVVASESEREKLRKMRLSQQSAHVGEESRCEPGKEVAANSSLVLSVGKDRAIKLKLIDPESGCVTQNSAGATARDAVENLLSKLRVEIAWPISGRRAPPPKPAESDPAQAAAVSLEAEFWSSIKQSRNAADYDAYLQQFPSGTFRLLAENRIKELRALEIRSDGQRSEPEMSGAKSVLLTALPSVPTAGPVPVAAHAPVAVPAAGAPAPKVAEWVAPAPAVAAVPAAPGAPAKTVWVALKPAPAPVVEPLPAADAGPAPTGAYDKLLADGLAAARADKWPKAIPLPQKALKTKPNPLAARELGRGYYNTDKFELARVQLDQATKLNPNDADAFMYLGIVLGELDQKPAAKKAYEQFLALEPKNSPRSRDSSNVLKSLKRDLEP